MSEELPTPLVPAEVDLRGLNGFMLRTDRLLSSELVALGTPEECWAAVLLWCRSWQQRPGASLPNDDRILASFSGAGRRWPKIRAMAMRGFVLCSDDRWYHKVLAEEAVDAWEKRIVYRAEQERNTEKLRKWREKKRLQNGLQAELPNQDGNGNVTGYETVKTGKGQGRDSDRTESIKTPAAATASLRANGKNRKTALPENFGQAWSTSMQQWLEKRGETQVKAHLIYFTGYARANGKQYADWEQAFQNAIRDDWAGVRKAVA